MESETKLKRRPAAKQWTGGQAVAVIALSTLGGFPVAIVGFGIPAWVPALSLSILLVLLLWRRTITLAPMSARQLRWLTAGLWIYALLIWGLSAVLKDVKEMQAVHMARLEALARSDPKGLAKALEGMQSYELDGLKEKFPAQVAAEEARQAKMRAAEQLRADSSTEAANAAAIKQELVKLKAVPSFDEDGQIAIYRKLVELAPANKVYQEKLDAIEQTQADRQYRLDHPEANISVIQSRWSKGGFGVAYILDITLKNVGSYSLKDFEVICENFAPSDTMLDATRGIIYERLSPGQTRRFRNVLLGRVPTQATRSRCRVAGAAPGG